MIAPSHGPVYGSPRLILDAYREWVTSPPQNMVVVPYISMHNSTRRMVEHFVEACARRGVRAEQFNLPDRLTSEGRRGTVGFALTSLQRRLASSPCIATVMGHPASGLNS